MARTGKAAFVFAALAALLWSPHHYVLEWLLSGTSPVPFLVAQFHFVFWAAVGLMLILFLSGRLDEVSVFQRRETRFLLLAAAGGYGFWTLRALAFDGLSPDRARLLFYLAPLLIGIFSLLGEERAGGRPLFGLVLGFVGCIMLLQGAPGAPGAGGGLWSYLAAVAAAACWALFALAVRPVVRHEGSLSVAAVVTAIGAVCILVTSISKGENPLSVTAGQLGAAASAGVVTVGLMMALWLKCLSRMPAVAAAPWWYLGLVFGTIGRAVVAGEFGRSVWWLLGGGVLVVMALQTAAGGRGRQAVTMGDLIRREGG
ncbi:MAG: DMT family transporter [Planctomycetota bacterium]